ncbi:MAG: RusA family crossover junction endodeoxyribonuclease [Herbinix sp.]|nr:RusA family crossover junction endodeoxyribonuclease [Herbinix sp.]
MSNKNRVKDYKDKYGLIPKDMIERFIYICDELKLSKKNMEKIVSQIIDIRSLKKERISFIIYLEPQATARPRVTRFTVFVPHSKENFELFKEFLDDIHFKDPIITPTHFHCTTYKAISQNMSKEEKILAELGLINPPSRPDWDNLAKTYSDMIQSGLLLDDGLITDSFTHKRFSFKPRIEITLEYDTKFNSKYTKRIIESWKQYQDLKNKPFVDVL